MSSENNKKVCIVTPDTIGPVKNGGIGTHCFYLAEELARKGLSVTLLFTGPLINGTHDEWKAYYAQRNVFYEHLHASEECSIAEDGFLETAYRVYLFCKQSHFDFIHFQDWHANGLVTIQAKRTTPYFDDTVLTVTLHSPTEWQKQGMKRWMGENPALEAKLMWAERYCVEYCDILLSPSRHMFNWGKANNWSLCNDQRVIPYCFAQDKSVSQKKLKPDTGHLVFFGRLETRKGLGLFVTALTDLIRHDQKTVRKVTFLGKVGDIHGENAGNYIQRHLTDIVEYELLTDNNSFEALEYLKQSNGVAVIPSLLDNYPFTIIECIVNEIPFLCSDAGGIPEMVDERYCFELGRKNSLTKLIESITEETFLSPKHAYQPGKSRDQWVGLHFTDECNSSPVLHKNPKVSICIPYYNYPLYLPHMIQSISQGSYSDFEVIIVNDGSTDDKANSVFHQLKNSCDKRFKFYEKANGGVGHTRNFAASKAEGEYLIFMDADNLAAPEMIEMFIAAIMKSKADCVTCYFRSFEENHLTLENIVPISQKLFLGQVLEMGPLENVYGDANFIIRSDVFDSVGGFNEDRETSWEDFEFLVRLGVKGFKQEVIPECLFWYRSTADGFSRNTDLYNNHKRVIDTYCNELPEFAQRMVKNLLVPYNVKENVERERLHHEMSFGTSPDQSQLRNVADFILPYPSRRRDIVRKLYYRFKEIRDKRER